jgi:hypothetical protein
MKLAHAQSRVTRSSSDDEEAIMKDSETVWNSKPAYGDDAFLAMLGLLACSYLLNFQNG